MTTALQEQPTTAAGQGPSLAELAQSALDGLDHVASELELRWGIGRLRLVVDDDGPGIGLGRVGAGQGIGNMIDRIGAVGGTLDVGRSPTGGARITATIPLRIASDAPAPGPGASADAGRGR